MPQQDSDSGPNESTATTSQTAKPGSCHSCRRRKIKCTSERPICSKCAASLDTCVYDEAPIRRGRDRQPRHRRPKKKQTIVPPLEVVWSEIISPDNPQPSVTAPVSSKKKKKKPLPTNSVTNVRPKGPVSDLPAVDPGGTEAHVSPKPDVLPVSQASPTVDSSRQDLVRGPSLAYYRSSWFHTLLRAYSENEEESVRLISDDVSMFFRDAHHLFPFIHIPTFTSRIASPETREITQPSLILSALAFSSLIQFSLGSEDIHKERALFLLSWAQSAMEASVAVGWYDLQLVQAAAILTMFHLSPHPQQTENGINEAVGRLDVLICALGLCQMDKNIPETSVISSGKSGTAFVRSLKAVPVSTSAETQLTIIGLLRNIPSIPSDLKMRPLTIGAAGPRADWLSGSQSADDCSCREAAFGVDIRQGGASWEGVASVDSPGWERSWTEAEIDREEARRVVWDSIGTFSMFSEHRRAVFQRTTVYRVMSEPQFRVLFPGEILHIIRGDKFSGKSTLWALMARSHFLWLSCQQVDRKVLEPEEINILSEGIEHEGERLDVALSKHRCGVEPHQVAVSRFFLYSARMCAIARFRTNPSSPNPGYFSSPQRLEAAGWIRLLKSYASDMKSPKNIDLVLMHRFSWTPWLPWSMVDQMSRALELWDLDHEFTVTIKLARRIHATFTQCLRRFTTSPCMEEYRDSLRDRIARAIEDAGLPVDTSMQGPNLP